MMEPHFILSLGYPSHKERLMRSLTEEKCNETLKKTQKLQQWIKAKL